MANILKEIKFKNSDCAFFLGRNGTFKSIGLNVFKISDKLIEFVPTTSKGKLGHCSICIPQEDIPNLIYTLTQML